jgi:catechol 2,3-dioxygenase-like lactoylglutathione lyase family enzyme
VGLARAELIGFVSTTDADRARAFYRDTLGLRLADESPFALVFDSAGTMLRVTAADRVDPAPYTVLGWAVADIDVQVDALRARGVEFIHYDGLEQDARGVWRSPSGGQIAWFRDPDGNVLSLTQF